MNKNENYAIRNEQADDMREVEELTRKAFWNLNVPGCNEHYLVHIMRNHPDFIPELDFVLENDNRIIGNIMYTKAKLVDEENNEKQILTFGPLSVLPEFQRKGYGKALLEIPIIMFRVDLKAVKSLIYAKKRTSIRRPCW